MSNQLRIGERPNKKNIESLDLTLKVNLLRLWHGNSVWHQKSQTTNNFEIILKIKYFCSYFKDKRIVILYACAYLSLTYAGQRKPVFFILYFLY